jgi:hypothetical protein
MSISGIPPEISVLQAAQAQREAAKARDRSRFGSERGRKTNSEDEQFRVAGLEDSAAIRGLDEEESLDDERSRGRRESQREEIDGRRESSPEDENPRLDITA